MPSFLSLHCYTFCDAVCFCLCSVLFDKHTNAYIRTYDANRLLPGFGCVSVFVSFSPHFFRYVVTHAVQAICFISERVISCNIIITYQRFNENIKKVIVDRVYK